MKKFCLLFCVFSLLIVFTSKAKEAPEYAVDNIPENYRNNYKSIIRESVVEIVIEGPDKILENHREVITIFRESAFDQALFIAHYNKFSSVSDIDIEIYDAKGERVENARNSDIKDYSAIDNATIFSDARVKAFEPLYKEFPLTIVRSWEIKKKTTFYIPWWTPLQGEDIPVLNSTLKISYPKDFDLRYRELNMPDVRSSSENEEQKTIQWTFNNYEPHDLEPFSPLFFKRMPTVFITPAEFELDGITGRMDSWESFGNFVARLNEGRQELPEETQNEINQLISGVESTGEKVRILYEYMQNKTRYVSIQVGIGGWQPFDAKTVDKLGYGDCKALSNYMRALLLNAGIESHYTLVRAGSYSSHLIPDFPNNNFNHAILCVPLSNDTLWLECTSQHNPCGFLGDFTDDREVLIIENKKGKMVRTPAFNENDNKRITSGTITIDNQGNATASSQTQFGGTYYDNNMVLIHFLDERDRQKKLIQSLHQSGFKLNNYSFEEDKSRNPSITRNLDFSINEYATTMGNRWMFPLNLLHQFENVPRKVLKRKWPVFIQRGWNEKDQWSIQLPPGYSANGVPAPVEISTPYGTYKAFVLKEDGILKYSREFTVFKGQYPPDEYQNFRNFLMEVAKADQQKCLVSSL